MQHARIKYVACSVKSLLSGREYERENTRCPSGSMTGDRGGQVGLSIVHESARDETTCLDSEAASGRLVW